MGIFSKLFGSYSDREVKKLQPTVDAVLALEDTYSALSEEELKGSTARLRERLEAGESLDAILPDAFATVREAAWRVLGMKHYPVQILGGIVLHQGRIAEMKTGEGKTLVATLAAYLNALPGKGVHVVTVNDYLAQRDSEWMGKVYRYLGLTVGLVTHDMDAEKKQEAYAADITYGTSNEFGFDYLRDNLALYKEKLFQRGHAFAIVDEVDSILIDEARTPLIISGQGKASSELYIRARDLVKRMVPYHIIQADSKTDYDALAKMDYDPKKMGDVISEAEHRKLVAADYIVEEKSKRVTLTAIGVEKAEDFFHLENLADPENMEISHHINQAMRARSVMKRDIDYVVKEGQVLIVDEFTGRIMRGRRYNQGLHQAIEAKEGITIEKESQTVATTTLQNYFRLYGKLSGMTGTALTEEEEFRHIYSLDVVEIPTNRTNIRVDHHDIVFKTEAAKYNYVIEQIRASHEKGQPVLVGTASIEKSEILSTLLRKEGIRHEVLNAKEHAREALIIAQAGKLGAVTIATNMAGRGTDILLGGNAEFMAKEALRKAGCDERLISEATGFSDTDDEEILAAREQYQKLYQQYKAEIAEESEKVRAAGGLYILGTERHESRRIDNQLRGRAARQGDPGETRFVLSLQDDLMLRFGGERQMAMLNAVKIPDDLPLDMKLYSTAIERAQEKVESIHFESRKTVLEYDDIINQQRELIYQQRRDVLAGKDLEETIRKMVRDYLAAEVASRVSGEDTAQWDLEGLHTLFDGVLLTPDDLQYTEEELLQLDPAEITALLQERAMTLCDKKELEYTEAHMREVERNMLLRSVDRNWMNYIDELEDLRQGIVLEAYGQRNPVQEFKFQSYDIFEAMVDNIKAETARAILAYQPRPQQTLQRQAVIKITGTNHGGGPAARKAPVRVDKKVGPNDPCPCGSGKKYKKCCGNPARHNA